MTNNVGIPNTLINLDKFINKFIQDISKTANTEMKTKNGNDIKSTKPYRD